MGIRSAIHEWRTRRSQRVLDVHTNRDLWIPLSVALVGLPGGTVVTVWTVQQTMPSRHISLWPTNPFVDVSAIGFLVGAYMVLALIFGWWLPGGFRSPLKDVVTPDATDEALGRECLLLAQSMWELISNAKRDEPGYAVETAPLHSSARPGEMHKAWQASVRARRIHENRTMGLFLERFGVRLGSVLQQLVSRGRMTQEEARSVWWKTQTIHWLDQIPQALTAKGQELGGSL